MTVQPLLEWDPESIGAYRLTGRLGAGGFGTVFAGVDADGRVVAVKMLRPELAADQGLRDRLAREGEAMRRVASDHTVDVIEVVTEGTSAYLVMELVDGVSLDEHVAGSGPLQGPILWFTAEALVSALAAIHRAGIVHRDLKPSNVMLSSDGVKVLDFGVSVISEHTSHTATGAFLGSAAWISPEQVQGKPATPASDVFMLGLIIGHAATGTHPFGTGRSDAVMFRIAHQEPDVSQVPPPLNEVVTACLATEPDERPTVEALAAYFAQGGNEGLVAGSESGPTGTFIVGVGTALTEPANAANDAAPTGPQQHTDSDDVTDETDPEPAEDVEDSTETEEPDDSPGSAEDPTPEPSDDAGSGGIDRTAVIASRQRNEPPADVTVNETAESRSKKPLLAVVLVMLAVFGAVAAFAMTNNTDTTQTTTAASTQTTTAPTTTVAPVTTTAPATTVAPATTTAPTTTIAPATTTAPTTTVAPATTAAPQTTSAPTTTAAPSSRCPASGTFNYKGQLLWWGPGYAPSGTPGETMRIPICGEDPAGLNFLRVGVGFDCQAGSRLTSGDLSASSDPTYYYTEFTCIVPPDLEPGNYSLSVEWNGNSGSQSIPAAVIISGTATSPTTTVAPTTTAPPTTTTYPTTEPTITTTTTTAPPTTTTYPTTEP